jgi:PPOX class probable F420-dependent enzyme
VAILPDEVRRLLDQPVPAVVTTTNKSGHPQASVVWIERSGDDISFFSDTKSLKIRNIEERPAVVVIVMDPERTFEPGAPCYVQITGQATTEPMTDTAFADRLAKRYMGAEKFPHEGNYTRVNVRTTTWGGIGPFEATPHQWGS